jgi:hypothetical protein
VKCSDYDPWKNKSELLLMDECFYFKSCSGLCDYGPGRFFGKPCPWVGYGDTQVEVNDG